MCVYSCVYVCVYVCTCVYTCVYACILVSCTCVYLRIHLYMYGHRPTPSICPHVHPLPLSHNPISYLCTALWPWRALPAPASPTHAPTPTPHQPALPAPVLPATYYVQVGRCHVLLRYKAGVQVGGGGFGDVWRGRRVRMRCRDEEANDCIPNDGMCVGGGGGWY